MYIIQIKKCQIAFGVVRWPSLK